MNFFPTPAHIVDVIRKHAPRSAGSVLEPAVGEGALLDIFPDAFNSKSLTLVDISRERLQPLRRRFEGAKFINSDFLAWAAKRKRRFDFILTNPPFSGKTSGRVGYEGKLVPIEVAFIELCFKLLSSGGTLIGIVPDSIINSSRWVDLRSRMFQGGSFTYVYQLPGKTFHKIEGVFFLFVYKKGREDRHVKLRRYSAPRSTIDLDLDVIRANDFRLDFDFFEAKFIYDKLILSSEDGPISVGSVLDFSRGKIGSDYRNPVFLHTTDLSNYPLVLNGGGGGYGLDESMIILKRVSRNANLSFSLTDPNTIEYCTDCLCVGRPLPRERATELLFSLRVMFSNPTGAKLLLKGAGAKFISITHLKSLPFINVSTIFPELFWLYKKYLINEEYENCLKIEKVLFDCLFGDAGRDSVEYARLKKLTSFYRSPTSSSNARVR